jgi:long-chain acyl-CoA synthetase
MKNIIIRHDGFKVYPIQITEVAMKHPNVCASTVIGVRDKNFSQGELPKLYVVLKDEKKKEKTLQELKDLCKEMLAEYLIPTEIVAIKELPKTSIGKIDFMKLKEEEENKVKKLTRNSRI